MLPWPWRIKPVTPCVTSRAGTLLSGSVSSVTSDVSGPTFATRPTRPSAVTIGVLTWIPELVPAEIVTCCAKGPLGYEMTVVFTLR